MICRSSCPPRLAIIRRGGIHVMPHGLELGSKLLTYPVSLELFIKGSSIWIHGVPCCAALLSHNLWFKFQSSLKDFQFKCLMHSCLNTFRGRVTPNRIVSCLEIPSQLVSPCGKVETTQFFCSLVQRGLDRLSRPSWTFWLGLKLLSSALPLLDFFCAVPSAALS